VQLQKLALKCRLRYGTNKESEEEAMKADATSSPAGKAWFRGAASSK
jgi:hypothetical protein